jgi:hypothetical protein
MREISPQRQAAGTIEYGGKLARGQRIKPGELSAAWLHLGGGSAARMFSLVNHLTRAELSQLELEPLLDVRLQADDGMVNFVLVHPSVRCPRSILAQAPSSRVASLEKLMAETVAAEVLTALPQPGYGRHVKGHQRPTVLLGHAPKEGTGRVPFDPPWRGLVSMSANDQSGHALEGPALLDARS